MIVLLFFLPFVLFLTFDGQRAIREFDVDITLVHSRQLGRDFVGLLMLGDVHGWSLAPGDLTAPERLDVETRRERTANATRPLQNHRITCRGRAVSSPVAATRPDGCSPSLPLSLETWLFLQPWPFPDPRRRLRRKHQTRAASQRLLMEVNFSL